MLELVTIEDRVCIAPKNFRKTYQQAIIDEIDAQYSNRILRDLGLCVVTHDVLSVNDPLIIQDTDGSVSVKCRFRMILFRPFIEEILLAKIKSSTKDGGLHCTMGFCQDVIIPPAFLPEGSAWDDQEQLWIWHYEGESFYMDINEWLRFKVMSVDIVPATSGDTPAEEVSAASPIAAAVVAGAGQSIPAASAFSSEYRVMKIWGAINQTGLGLVNWW